MIIIIVGGILNVIKGDNHNELAHINQLCADLAHFNKTIRIVYEMWGDKLNTPHNLNIRKLGERYHQRDTICGALLSSTIFFRCQMVFYLKKTIMIKSFQIFTPYIKWHQGFAILRLRPPPLKSGLAS